MSDVPDAMPLHANTALMHRLRSDDRLGWAMRIRGCPRPVAGLDSPAAANVGAQSRPQEALDQMSSAIGVSSISNGRETRLFGVLVEQLACADTQYLKQVDDQLLNFGTILAPG